MRVTIGPLPSGAATEWLTYANETLDHVRGAPLPFAVPPEVVEEFRSYLNAWTATACTAAADGVEFVWSGEAEAHRVRVLMTYWLNIARFLADGKLASRPVMTAAIENFYEAVVASILSALAEEEPVARVIEERWPLREPAAGAMD